MTACDSDLCYHGTRVATRDNEVTAPSGLDGHRVTGLSSTLQVFGVGRMHIMVRVGLGNLGLKETQAKYASARLGPGVQTQITN